jgi:hypothetical protein
MMDLPRDSTRLNFWLVEVAIERLDEDPDLSFLGGGVPEGLVEYFVINVVGVDGDDAVLPVLVDRDHLAHVAVLLLDLVEHLGQGVGALDAEDAVVPFG